MQAWGDINLQNSHNLMCHILRKNVCVLDFSALIIFPV